MEGGVSVSTATEGVGEGELSTTVSHAGDQVAGAYVADVGKAVPE